MPFAEAGKIYGTRTLAAWNEYCAPPPVLSKRALKEVVPVKLLTFVTPSKMVAFVYVATCGDPIKFI